jgi:hypothetical protein
VRGKNLYFVECNRGLTSEVGSHAWLNLVIFHDRSSWLWPTSIRTAVEMSTLSRDQAKELISKIRQGNGGISSEERKATPPGVLVALAELRRKVGANTKTYEIEHSLCQ